MPAKPAIASHSSTQRVFRYFLFLAAALPAPGILQAIEVATPATDSDAAVRTAVAAGDPAALKAALTAGGHAEQARKMGVTLLMDAAERGAPEMVDLLLGAGAVVDRVTSWNETALAAGVRGGSPKVVASLLAAGADVNHRAKLGFSPLIVAIGTGRLEIVRQLLAGAADPNQAAAGSTPPLQFAAVQGRVEIARALLAAGARLDATDELGRDALALAVDGGHEDTIAFFEQATGRKAARPQAARIGSVAAEVGDINFRRFTYVLDGRPVEVHDGVHEAAGPDDLAIDSTSEVLGDLGRDGEREAAILVHYRSLAGAGRTAVIVFAIRVGKLVELGRLPEAVAGQGAVLSIGIDGGRLQVLRGAPQGGQATEFWHLAGAGLVPAPEP